MSRWLPMFPLGTVLVPGAVLPLHVFEARYRALMAELTDEAGRPRPHAELGVVLIERGHEVGGGDQRAGTGTVARLLQAERLADGRWLAAFAGTTRVRVERWLPDDPYPQAEVEDIGPDGPWDPSDDDRLAEVTRQVRRALAMAAELGEAAAPATFPLAEDPAVAAWELCAVAPVGVLDRQRLLEVPAVGERLDLLAAQVHDVASMLALRMARE